MGREKQTDVIWSLHRAGIKLAVDDHLPWSPPGHERFRTGKPTTDVLAADPTPV